MTTITAEGWDATEISVDTVMETGEQVRIHGVPAHVHKTTREVRVEPQAVLRAQFRDLAAKYKLQEQRDIALLSIIGASAGNLPARFVVRKYLLNKMLFYQWKQLEEVGLGDAFPRDEFIADRKGPVPEHINDDLERLASAGLVKIRKHKAGETTHVPWIIELTPQGAAAAEVILSNSDVWFREATAEVKTKLFALDPEKLKARVHTDYPEYKRAYVEIDAE